MSFPSRTIDVMALPIEHHHGMTVAEFERYCDDHPDERVELIDGEICTVSPLSVLHVATALAIQDHLKTCYPDALVIAGGASVELDDGSLWEPDVLVVKALPDAKYLAAADVLHIAEVSLSSMGRDSGAKYLGYARNLIPEYWLIDPKPGGVFHRFSNPADGTYRTVYSTPLPDGLRSLKL